MFVSVNLIVKELDRPAYACMKQVQIFLSTVSSEFKSYRDALSADLKRPNVTVEVQETFIATGTLTLDKLDDYIKACDVVIHLVGDMTGADAHPAAIASIRSRYPDLKSWPLELRGALESGVPSLSYTQWEAYLAIYHGRPLIIATPEERAPRDGKFMVDAAQQQAQARHLERLNSMGRYAEIAFANTDNLSKQILRSSLLDLLATVPSMEVVQQRRNRYGKNQFDELKHLLLNERPTLRNEGFLYSAFVQIKGSTSLRDISGRMIESVLLDELANADSANELLMLVYLCVKRAGALAENDLKTRLEHWLSNALATCDVTLAAVIGCHEDAHDCLDPHRPPKPSLEVAWQSAPASLPGTISIEAYLRWGRCREWIPLNRHTLPNLDQIPTCVVTSIDESKESKCYRHIPFARMDVFVSESGLNRPWEYEFGTSPSDDKAELLRFPVVVRLLRRKRTAHKMTVPSDPINRNGLKCWAGECPPDLRISGAFFAVCGGLGESGTAEICKAALDATIGFWLRTGVSLDDVEQCLNELEVPLADIPEWVFRKKLEQAKDSPWRQVSVLYDLPKHYDPLEWSGFEFSSDEDNETELIRSNQRLA